MGNFVIPRFQYIINNDEQTQLYGDDGTGPAPYSAALVTPSAGKVAMIGELDWFNSNQFQVIDTAIRIRVGIADAGDFREVAYTVGGDVANVKAGHVFRVVTDKPSKNDTAYQNIPVEKRYQLPRDCATEDEVATAMADAINADTHSLVSVSVATNVLTVADLDHGAKSNVYIGLDPAGDLPVWELSPAVITEGKLPQNTYGALINLQWANGVDFDRNAEYYPERGATYKSYYFKLRAEEVASGGHSLPSAVPGISEVEYIFYAKEGTAFETAMNLLAIDMNV